LFSERVVATAGTVCDRFGHEPGMRRRLHLATVCSFPSGTIPHGLIGKSSAATPFLKRSSFKRLASGRRVLETGHADSPRFQLRDLHINGSIDEFTLFAAGLSADDNLKSYGNGKL
jgi:hypothetical protein